MSDFTIELNVAKKAAKAASVIIKDFRNKNSFSVNFKGKNDLVTEADVKAEEEIISIIKENFPDDFILAEESSDKQEIPDGRTWLIDPIDGTTNFTHGFPVFCVSIGLWKNGEPKMGLVLEVSRDECFTAIQGKGAYLNGNPITVSKREDPANALIGTGFPYNDLSLIDHYMAFFRMLITTVQGIRRPGAASYDLCCVACGRFEGFYEYALNPWDVGAAVLIVQEAGGQVSDWSGGDDWLFGKRIVAGNSSVYSFLLDEIANYFDEEEIDVGGEM